MVHQAGAVFIVDAISSFGAIPVDLAAVTPISSISSANKCIEGVPGFGFVLARRDRIAGGKGPCAHAEPGIFTRSGPDWNP